MSLTPTARATDPSPANYLNMHSRLVSKDTKKIEEKKTGFKLAHKSDMLFNQKSPVHLEAGFPQEDDKPTLQPLL